MFIFVSYPTRRLAESIYLFILHVLRLRLCTYRVHRILIVSLYVAHSMLAFMVIVMIAKTYVLMCVCVPMENGYLSYRNCGES